MHDVRTCRIALQGGLALFVTLLQFSNTLAVAETAQEARVKVQKEFAELDTDGQPGLTLEEYLQRAGDRDELQRNFRVFDFDANEVLTSAEFSAIPGMVSDRFRGAIPSPLEDLADIAIEALDDAFGWGEQPEQLIPSPAFALGYATALGLDQQMQLTIRNSVDKNRDRNIDRDEAIAFVRLQLGFLKYDVELREPNGRYVEGSYFMHLDRNSDHDISREEFFAHFHDRKLAEQKFPKADANDDDSLSMAEFCHPDFIFWLDPVQDFLKYDTDLSGTVNAEELMAGTYQHFQPLCPWAFPGFDDDGDGQLSLLGFCLLPQNNLVIPWHVICTDTSRDQSLSAIEFMQAHECQLLARLYFHRLDTDGSGELSQQELAFKVQRPDGIFRLSADGSTFEEVFSSEELVQVGSQAISPDGQFLAFDGRGANTTFDDTHIYILTLATGELRQVASGAMPMWSPDGTQLACSLIKTGRGVGIINLDGELVEPIAEQGWGAQWSPDGNFICYAHTQQVFLYDIHEKASRVLLSQSSHPYNRIEAGLSWSPDSQRLCFRGQRANGVADLVSVAVSGETPDVRVHYSSKEYFLDDFPWSPDGQRIYFAKADPKQQNNLLYSVPFAEQEEPQLVPGIPTDQGVMGFSCWSPDGKWLYVHQYFHAAIPEAIE